MDVIVTSRQFSFVASNLLLQWILLPGPRLNRPDSPRDDCPLETVLDTLIRLVSYLSTLLWLMYKEVKTLIRLVLS
jgi:hypothetical protein